MGAKLYIGNGQVTPSIAFEKQVPMPYSIQKAVDANGKLTITSDFIDLTGVTDVANVALYYAYSRNTLIPSVIDLSNLITLTGWLGCAYMFFGCSNLTSVNLSSLTSIGGTNGNECNNMFENCTNLVNIDLSKLTTINGIASCNSMFKSCSSLTNIDLSSLITVGGSGSCCYMFQYCSKITNVNLSKLTAIQGDQSFNNVFQGCRELTSVDLSSLTAIGNRGSQSTFSDCSKLTNFIFHSLASLTYESCSQMFRNCTSLVSLSFPSLKIISYSSAFNNMLQGVTGCTVHFPSNLQSVIGSWTSVTSGFGGTNTTVLFDLPATNTLTGVDTVTYTRNPKYDTQTALAWKVGAYGTSDFTPAYYTSGLTDPVVGTTIYSDSACTTAVTTVDTIV